MKNLLSKIKTKFEDNPIRFISPFAAIFLSLLIILFSFIPSSAADEPSVGGGPAAPTDLTGTTWSVSSGWTASAGYGIYDLTFDVTLGNVTYTNASSLKIGYSVNQSSQSANRIAFITSSPSNSVIYSYNDFSITFHFGNSISDTSLISWLMANGTWTNPPEPEPTPTYTIPAGSYLINETTDMPPLLSPYTYTSRFSYDGKVYTNLVFNRQGIFLIDEAGDHLGIYQRANVTNPWSGDRNFTLLTEIVTEDEDLYNYFINNTQPYEPDVFDVVVYIINGFFKALDKFVIFYNFSLLDFIFVMCGLLAAIWFLKVLAGG